ncbi:MAG: FAD-dependent oxidoreductase [Rhodospirillales bacterium]
MKSHVRVAVIGGGVIGCATLYHLAHLGWRDIALFERSELTSGSTWHAAAGFGVLHDDTNMARLNYYTIECYRGLEAETGQSCGIHTTGALYLAETEARLDQLRIMEAKAKHLGFDFRPISPREVPDWHPLLDASRLKGAWYQPDEGHLDPSGMTHAFARGARQLGAEVHRFTKVLETNPLPDGTWQVVTDKGSVIAEYLVNAAGLWAREVGRMAGLELPVIPMEHMYLVTETIPEIAALDRELPSVSDRDAEYYMRQEGDGLLVGAYERQGKHWSVEATPWDFGHELLPDDLDRISDNLERAVARTPALGRTGIKRVINGPMMWSPDASGMLGPVPGLTNYFAAVGIMTGIGSGGGLGKCVAEWIVGGAPEWDVASLDIARFGDYFTQDFILARSAENYGSRFRMHFPKEELTSGRPQRVRESYPQQVEQGAVFGVSFGWENPQYFAQCAAERDPGYAYRRAKWFEPVGREARALRARGGIIDTSPYAKYLIAGPAAEAWLDSLVTNRLPQGLGRITLCPVVSAKGRLLADFTVTRLGAERFFLVGSGSAVKMHQRILADAVPREGVSFEDLTERWAGFSISGPRARDVLAALTDADISPAGLPFLTGRDASLLGRPAIVLRLSFTGEMGFEVYSPDRGFGEIYAALRAAAAAEEVAFCGSLAQDSLRLEKGYGSVFTEYTADYTPYDAGLERFVKLDKGAFQGREALVEAQRRNSAVTLKLFAVESDAADCIGGEPIWKEGRIVGETTSGGYGFTVGQSLALAYVTRDEADAAADYRIPVVGQLRPARLLAEAPYDPQGARLRD